MATPKHLIRNPQIDLTQKVPHILKISPCEKRILKNSLKKRGVLL